MAHWLAKSTQVEGGHIDRGGTTNGTMEEPTDQRHKENLKRTNQDYVRRNRTSVLEMRDRGALITSNQGDKQQGKAPCWGKLVKRLSNKKKGTAAQSRPDGSINLNTRMQMTR